MRTLAQSIRVTGLRDYRWAFELFPGRVGPTDVDCVVHREQGNRFLVMEFKQANEDLGVGQVRFLTGLARMPEFSVVVVRETPDGLLIATVDRDGLTGWRAGSLRDLQEAAKTWWHEGYFSLAAA